MAQGDATRVGMALTKSKEKKKWLSGHQGSHSLCGRSRVQHFCRTPSFHCVVPVFTSASAADKSGNQQGKWYVVVCGFHYQFEFLSSMSNVLFLNFAVATQWSNWGDLRPVLFDGLFSSLSFPHLLSLSCRLKRRGSEKNGKRSFTDPYFVLSLSLALALPRSTETRPNNLQPLFLDVSASPVVLQSSLFASSCILP